MMNIPQIALLETIKILLEVIRRNSESNVNTPEKTLLYHLFHSEVHGKYSFLDQANDLFLRGIDHPKKISMHLSYDRAVASTPSIAVTLPTESDSLLGIGNNEGTENVVVIGDRRVPVFRRNFDGRINLVITSDNEIEILLIYEVLRALLLTMSPHLELQFGLQNVRFSGQDISMPMEGAPFTFQSRVLQLSFTYAVSVPAVFNYSQISQLLFQGNISDDINSWPLDDLV